MADLLFEVQAVISDSGSASMARNPLSFEVNAPMALPVPADVGLQPLSSIGNVFGKVVAAGTVSAALSPMAMGVLGRTTISGGASFVFYPIGFQVSASEVLEGSVTLTRQIGFEVVGGVVLSAQVGLGLSLSFEVQAMEALSAETASVYDPMGMPVRAPVVIAGSVTMGIISSRDILAGQTLLLEATSSGETLASMVDRWRMLVDKDDVTIAITGDSFPLED